MYGPAVHLNVQISNPLATANHVLTEAVRSSFVNNLDSQIPCISICFFFDNIRITPVLFSAPPTIVRLENQHQYRKADQYIPIYFPKTSPTKTPSPTDYRPRTTYCANPPRRFTFLTLIHVEQGLLGKVSPLVWPALVDGLE
jgi:hypothetical protein